MGGWVGGMGGGGRAAGRKEDKSPHRRFGAAVATRGSHKAPTMSRRRHGAMAVALGHGSPTGAHQRRHSLNRDITGSENYPPEKQTS